MSGSIWAQPVDEATIAKARTGTWEVVLTPKTPVPKAWFGDLRGQRVLCLASGGGQQAPILAAAGATVVSFDLSEEQLRKDQLVAERDRLDWLENQALAEGTKAIASGNLDHRVTAQAGDEIGLLIGSFNRMTEELRSNREAIDASRRRWYARSTRPLRRSATSLPSCWPPS